METTVEIFLKEKCTKVRANEPIHYIELMMDNHKCIHYGNKEYYVPEDNLSDEEEIIYEFLISNYLW